MTPRQTTRRGFLAATATTTVGVAVAATTPAAASIEDYSEANPSHVSITYDESTLSRYQPSLAFPSEMTIRPTAIYAWTSTSPEWGLDAHTYVVYYQTQDTDVHVTSHRHDREIVQIYTHPEYGEVREAVYSAGHWAAYRDTEPHTHEPDAGDGEHVKLAVHPRYRHMLSTRDVGSTDIELEPLGTSDTLYQGGTQFEVFLENGWDGALQPGLLQAADRARFAEHYWADGASRWDRFAASNASWLAGSFLAPLVAPELQESEYA